MKSKSLDRYSGVCERLKSVNAREEREVSHSINQSSTRTQANFLTFAYSMNEDS
jgi:hypothetical protein